MSTTSYANRQRDGMTKIIQLAQTICRVVAVFRPIISAKYSDNPAIVALLITVDELCAALPAAADSLYAPEGDNSDPLADPENIPGIRTGLPLPPEPEPEE